MRQGDLSRDNRVLVGDVRGRVLAAVLEHDGESHLELVEVDVARFPMMPTRLPISRASSTVNCRVVIPLPPVEIASRLRSHSMSNVHAQHQIAAAPWSSNCPSPGEARRHRAVAGGVRTGNSEQNHAADATSLWPSGLRFARSAKTETPIE